MPITPTTTTAINVGVAPNDGTGDPIRTGGQIINENTLKLYNLTNKIQANFMQIFKHPDNGDIETVEQNDVVQGIVEDGVNKFFIKAQYNTGNINDFGTESGDFNDGSYITFEYLNL